MFDAFAQSTKMMNRFNLFATIHFPQKVPLDTQIAFMTSLPKIYAKVLTIFYRKSQKTMKRKVTLSKNNHQNVPLETQKAVLPNLLENFAAGLNVFCSKSENDKNYCLLQRKAHQNVRLDT